jgi:hypothetical protein
MQRLGEGIMAGMAANGGEFDPDEDFYEDDEPLEEVRAAYERGIKGVTARPVTLERSAPRVLMRASSKTAPARVTYESAEPVRVNAAQVC